MALGSRRALLAAVGSRQLDADALGKIGAKYGVDAIFLGEISYSEKTDVKITEISRLEGGVRSVIRGDIFSKLVQTRGGASVWSSAAWATRQVGRVNVSAERGVSGTVQSSNPREEMVPTLLFHLTQDFRPSTVRQPAK